MKGAILVAAAIQRERKALKDNMSVSQVGGFWSSQASSIMMPVEFSVKIASAVSRMPCVRVFHIAEPFVCGALLDMLRILQDEAGGGIHSYTYLPRRANKLLLGR